MLDSSPVALPPISRPLKRSASVASLPTPPRTRHKGKHARAGSQYDSDSDRSETASEGEGEEELKLRRNMESKYKKRRTSDVQDEEEEEDAFWMTSTKRQEDGNEQKKRGPATRTSSFAAPPLLYQRTTGVGASTSASTAGQAPVSPPPSNRRHGAGASSNLLAARPMRSLPARHPAPITPPRKKGPVRDSPNNPFLVSPVMDVPDSSSDFSSPDASPRHRGRVHPMDEKPTIKMVFRGQRGEIPNPYYNHRANRPLSPSAESRLPIDHADYSPSAQCAPKLLFPQARRCPRKVSSASKHRDLDKELGRDAELGQKLGPSRDGRAGRLGHARSSSATAYDSDGDGDRSDSDHRGNITPMKLFGRTITPDKKIEGGLAGARVPPIPVPPADL